MLNLIKYLGWINLIGFPLVLMALIMALEIRPFAWGFAMIIINLIISIPFIIVNIITIRNLKNQNESQIQILFILTFILLASPTVTIPFIFDLNEMLLWLLFLIPVIWAILRIRKSIHRLMFISSISTLGLSFNLLLVIGHL